MEKIETKIKDLGGIRENPVTSNNPTDTSELDILIAKLENELGEKFPKIYVDFYRMYGSFAFNNRVGVKYLESCPAKDENNHIPVNYFYTLGGGDNSIFEILSLYSDMMPEKHLPICDGQVGDSILISLRKETYGSIYYWSPILFDEENNFLLADSFDELISNLIILPD